MDQNVDAFENSKPNIVSPSLSRGILKLRNLVIVSLFSSLSFLLMYCVEFPLIPAFPVLKYDPSDVPALIAGFAINSSAGIYVIILKDIMFLLSGKGFVSLGIGTLMNMAAGIVLVFAATRIYSLKPCKKFAIAGLIGGTICMTLIMIPLNYIILSILPFILPQLGKILPFNKALIFLFAGTVPFNLIKGFLSSILTFVLYKKLSNFIKK